MRKKLKDILEAIADKTNEGEIWYLFSFKGAKKVDVEELEEDGMVKPAGKPRKPKNGWKATKAGFAEAGYE